MDQTTRLPLGFDLSCDQPQMPNVYHGGFTQLTVRWDCGGVVTSKKSDFFPFGSSPVLRYSIGTTFNIFWRSPGPVPTRFLLSKPKLKYMQNYQGFQNPPNPIRKKSDLLGLCRLSETVTGPDPAKPAYRWDCGGVERATLSLRILTCFRCSIGAPFKTVQRLPAPKPTKFLLTHPKLKNIRFGQGFQNPSNPIREKSSRLGRGQTAADQKVGESPG